MYLDLMLLLVVAGIAVILFLPRVRHSSYWRATVTPLASIIGSGFLVVAPLLSYAVGIWAPVAMAAILLFAYAMGAVIRFNISHLEPMLEGRQNGIKRVEQFSNITLSLAYIVSVAFYIRLLVAFLLRPFDNIEDSLMINGITTAILLIIGVTGWLRGLKGLEWMEQAAVNIKLSIIGGLLLGLVWYDRAWLSGGGQINYHGMDDPWHALRLLGGLLLVIQGFETSRYLGASYDARTRQKTMRYAQWLTAAIYMAFVLLVLPLLKPYSSPPAETAIVDISSNIASTLPGLLIIAAIMSQFSAAVADTAGSGGMLAEATSGRVSERGGYTLVIMLAIALIWSVDIFSIIAIASRAFAFYYLVQCLAAFMAAGKLDNTAQRFRYRVGVTVLAILLAIVVVFAIPAESAGA